MAHNSAARSERADSAAAEERASLAAVRDSMSRRFWWVAVLDAEEAERVERRPPKRRRLRARSVAERTRGADLEEVVVVVDVGAES